MSKMMNLKERVEEKPLQKLQKKKYFKEDREEKREVHHLWDQKMEIIVLHKVQVHYNPIDLLNLKIKEHKCQNLGKKGKKQKKKRNFENAYNLFI